MSKLLPRAERLLMEEQRVEGKRFLQQFGLQGAIWFAEGVSFKNARARWQKMLEKDVRQLTLKIGKGAATFAADIKLKKRLNAELKEED